jgi:hypothetical protein
MIAFVASGAFRPVVQGSELQRLAVQDPAATFFRDEPFSED